MSDNEKSTDPGLSTAERKAQRSQEAQEAIADHEDAQKAFHENRSAYGKNVCGGRQPRGRCSIRRQNFPTTHFEQVRFSIRIRNALNAGGMKTIGEVRETSDDNLLSLQDLGPSSISYLRETLGLPQPTGSDLWAKSPPDLLNFQ